MSNLRSIGAEAEDRAATYLLELGYTIVTRRFKSSRGEIDIIALDEDVLVVIEVKSSRTNTFVPEESVTFSKTENIVRAVEEYLYKTAFPESPVRYDIIAVTPQEIRHHIDAFRPV